MSEHKKYVPVMHIFPPTTEGLLLVKYGKYVCHEKTSRKCGSHVGCTCVAASTRAQMCGGVRQER